jgi:DNA-binding NtrC family response regulator
MKLLVVEDEPHIRQGIVEILDEEGIETIEADSVTNMLTRLTEESPDAILCDVYLPDGDGFDVLSALHRKPQAPPCILMTAFGDRNLAIRALTAGAYDYVAKPLRFDELLARLHRLETQHVMRKRLEKAESDVRAKSELAILGNSEVMKQVRKVIEKAATTRIPVLIQGETGVGKGIVARLLHSIGVDNAQPFVRVNCAAIPKDLMESELFGHKRGAFSGAERDHEGLLAEARKGTLFLDEIGELSLTMQAKLLHVLDERTFRPLGSTKEQVFRARVISASNRDLKEEVARGAFREDLYYRLDVLNICIPPLRDRCEDIVPLATRLLAELAEETAIPVPRLTPEQALWLQTQSWPGNIRELRNTLERALLLSQEGEFTLQPHLGWKAQETISLPKTLAQIEYSLIEQAIRDCQGDKAKAARRLGISLSSLYRKLEH